MLRKLLFVSCLALWLLAAKAQAQPAALQLQQGDRIVFMGNTFAERLRNFGYFETMLLARFPELRLTFRNMGWSADEVNLRPRPLDFGDIHVHLTDQKADVVFLFYGINESFKGSDGLRDYIKEYQQLLDDLLEHQYNGESAPRLVIVSPTPLEEKAMTPVAEQNKNIELYSRETQQLAEKNGIPFLDIFTPLKAILDNPKHTPLTINAIHFNEYGDALIADLMMTGLGFQGAPPLLDLSFFGKQANVSNGSLENLRWEGRTLNADFSTLGAIFPNAYETLLKNESVVLEPLVLGNRDQYSSFNVSGVEVISGYTKENIFNAFKPFLDHFEAIRQKTIYKNQLFFDRWRAVNGYYIYGGRKEPFGVISFPPEMRRFDELAAKEDEVIADMAQKKVSVPISVRVKD